MKTDIYGDSNRPDTAHPTAVIHPSVQFKGRSIIRAGAVVGSIPFAFDIQDGHRVRRIPRKTVSVYDDVEVFEGATIDLGIEVSTILGDGAKIGQQAHVGHDAFIGNNAIVCPGARVLGYAYVGLDCYIGAGAVIKNRVTLGDRVRVGANAFVIDDVPDDCTVEGNPARIIRRAL